MEMVTCRATRRSHLGDLLARLHGVTRLHVHLRCVAVVVDPPIVVNALHVVTKPVVWSLTACHMRATVGTGISTGVRDVHIHDGVQGRAGRERKVGTVVPPCFAAWPMHAGPKLVTAIPTGNHGFPDGRPTHRAGRAATAPHTTRSRRRGRSAREHSGHAAKQHHGDIDEHKQG